MTESNQKEGYPTHVQKGSNRARRFFSWFGITSARKASESDE